MYKLCGNAFIIGLNALVADVFSVAAGAGVPATETLKVLEYFNVASAITGRGRNMATRNYAPAFELAMARKDVRLMIETAGERPLATLRAMAERMDALIEGGHGHEDLAVIGIESVLD